MDEQFDSLKFMIDFENGDATDEETISGFQHLIDSGLVWKLQGYYGRMATQLIDAGYCHR
jgi:hypothetical protein